MNKYDYLIVGSGLFGLVFAHEAKRHGKKCLIIEKRVKIGGNIRTEEINGINVHVYGPHIFHTNDKEIWDYMNQFAEFNNFVLSPIANYHGKLFNLPFNMNTFNQMWGVTTPADAIVHQLPQTNNTGDEPKNLEEQAIRLVGEDVYKTLVKEYTEKQWGKPCSELPAFIIKRLPVRYTFNNNYFNHRYQGIPIGGYTKIIEKLAEGIDVITNCDYFNNRKYFNGLADKIVYTGPIDRFFEYKFGKLDYRSLRFKTESIHEPNYQGCAVMNFTSHDVSYTRIIEHKHFESLLNDDVYTNPYTIITKEYPDNYEEGKEPYYPINDGKNNELYAKYKWIAEHEAHNVIFGGRLGEYKYYDMDQVIRKALDVAKKELN